MRLSISLLTTLAVVAHAAPTVPSFSSRDNGANAFGQLSGYFNLIASKIKEAKDQPAPVCDLSKAHMPTGIDGLPAPDDGLTVRHVAVGRGTQNYTCDTSKDDAVPKATGATATLFNASCIAALYPDVLSRIPGMAVHFEIDRAENALGVTPMGKSGVHYFIDATTPFFDLDTAHGDFGQVPCAKNSSADAPVGAAVGEQGEKAVPWLRLTSKVGTTGGIRDVYRVDTAGGSPPATCKGMPAAFQVEYAAVYWFWQGK